MNAVGWNKAAGWIQLYNRDTNSDTWKKYWKPKKPTRKLYFNTFSTKKTQEWSCMMTHTQLSTEVS